MDDLGPIPAVMRFSTEAAYAHLRWMIATVPRMAGKSVRSYRSLVHDELWMVARELLVEVPDAEVIQQAGTEVLCYRERFMFQAHKIDEDGRLRLNGTERPLGIQGQGHLWQSGAVQEDGEVWLTVGHEPNVFTHKPVRVIMGVAIDGGVADFQHIPMDVDRVVKIGSQAESVVRRVMDGMDG